MVKIFLLIYFGLMLSISSAWWFIYLIYDLTNHKALDIDTGKYYYVTPNKNYMWMLLVSVVSLIGMVITNVS